MHTGIILIHSHSHSHHVAVYCTLISQDSYSTLDITQLPHAQVRINRREVGRQGTPYNANKEVSSMH